MSKTKKKSIQYVDAGAAAEKAASGFVGKSVSLPEGFSFLPIKEEKEFRFRFAPYIVGKGNPEAPEGQVHYTRKYAVHGSVGGSEDGKGGDTYVCSRRVFNKPCAVCDYLGTLRQNPNTDPELLKALRIKDRQLFIVRDQANKDKGWQILDLSYHALGKQLEAKLKPSRLASSDDDEMPTYPAKHFFFLEGGASVRILFEVPKGMTKFYQAASIDIVPTKEVLPDDLLEKMPCLDDLLVETPYKVLEKILTEGAPDPNDDDEDDDEDQPKAKAGKKVKPKDDDDEDEEEDDDDEVDDDTPEVKSKYKKGDVVKFSFKGKTVKGTVLAVNSAGMLSVKSDLRDAPHSLDEDEIEGVVKKGKDEPKPGTAKAKAEAKKKANPKDEDDEDDEEELKDDEDEDDDIETDDDDEEETDDDDEEDEEEKPKKKAGKSSKKPEFSDDDDDDDDFSIDDEEDEEEKPKKKAKR